MAKDASAPATKEDIRLLMEQVGHFYREWDQRTREWKQEIKDHFDLVTENQLYDFKGIFSDRTEDHERRIKRLERKAGSAA